jgi:microcystin-dependent protein
VPVTITAVDTFKPVVPGAPFILDANAQGHVVTGLNADQLEGSHASVTPGSGIIPIGDSSGLLNQGFIAPVGSMWMYGGSSAPSGWLFCDASAVSRTTYSALYTIIGTTFGSGDGSTTFNLPDLKGRTPIGAGTGSGLTARARGDKVGEENHALSTAELASHGHSVSATSDNQTPTVSITDPGHTHAVAGPDQANSGSTRLAAGSTSSATGSNTTGITASQSAHSHTITVSQSNAGSGTAHNTMQPSICLNFIIKY